MVPEEKLNEFVSRARAACGPNLESIILFGSAASGDFHAGLSDLNLFCILRDSSFAELQKLATVVTWWTKEKQPPPQCMTRHELGRSTDVFAIELLDMVQHHRVLFGEDVLAGLHVPMDLHRVQVEYELREKIILLRQHLLAAGGKDSRLWDVLLHSAPSFATLFRHALIVLKGDAPANRRDALQALAKQAGLETSAIEQVLDVHERKNDPKKLNVQDLCARYQSAIEKVTEAVDQATAARSGSR